MSSGAAPDCVAWAREVRAPLEVLDASIAAVRRGRS
jgi:hypothetical protein